MKTDTPIFIPSYHRAENIKTAKYFAKLGWEKKNIYVVIDNETDDREEYEKECQRIGCELRVFDMAEARRRYDYVHRPSVSRRSAGQARNMFQDIAAKEGIEFYCVMDDDTAYIESFFNNGTSKPAAAAAIRYLYKEIELFMKRHKIGVFGLPQSGDFIGGYAAKEPYLYMHKVMNTTFYLLPYIYRGERGQQDNDTSLFCGIHNAGLFTGSAQCGYSLHQFPSATAKGGLTDIYNECKLLQKALTVPIQYPSAVYAEKQKKNGGRLHHKINYNFLAPKLIKSKERNNIAWDSYEEDIPFTNEGLQQKETC